MTLNPENILSVLVAPFTNPLMVLLIVGMIPALLRRLPGRHAWAVTAVFGPPIILWGTYHLICLNPTAAEWLSTLNNPIAGAFLVIVYPAMLIPEGRWRQVFLVIPVGFVLWFFVAIYRGYQTVPADESGFYWLLVSPSWLISGVMALLVILHEFMDLKWFRRTVRATCLLVLIYGGFALRQDFSDYRNMLDRRAEEKNVMTLQETSPVMEYPNKMIHLPSAPCRFSTDGGYVQGCNLELFQRLLHINMFDLGSGSLAAMNTLSAVLAALMIFVAFSFISARWCCGWLCPLSTIGDVLNWMRKRLGLPAMHPPAPVKTGFKISGLSLVGVTFLMAKATPHLGEDGRFAGCKIPIFPFCKVCPGQQVCPVAGGGLDEYPPLPGTEWAFGFFRYGMLAVLGLFVVSFMLSKRLWCRFCPMGMFSGLFNRGGMFALQKRAQKCDKCGVCAEVCPMDIETVRDEMKHPDVSSFDCVLCLRCVEKCPQTDCLRLEHNGITVTSSTCSPEHLTSEK